VGSLIIVGTIYFINIIYINTLIMTP